MRRYSKHLSLLSLFFIVLAVTLASAQNTYTDPKTQTVKTCHFSCAKCSDSSDLCNECQTSMNFFIKECFSICPRGYQPSNNDSSSTSAVECIPDAQKETRDQDTLQKKFSSMCSLSQFWDGAKCQNCIQNCIACSNSLICEECVQGYFWDAVSSKCSQCHSSCSSCKGPNFNDCLACSSLSSFYPDVNGVCDKAAQKIDFTVKYTKKSDLIANLKDCSAFLKPTPMSYSVPFKNLYTQNDAKWAGVELVDQNQCQIATFASKYSAQKDQISKCQYSQISKNVMGTKGSQITSYAMILSQHLAQLNGSLVNPQSLSAYINQQQLQSILFLKKARQDFTCDQLSCENQINSSLPFISTSSKTKVSLKISKEITLTQNGKTIDCFDQTSSTNSIDDAKLNEFETAITQSAFSQKSSNVKLYAIVDVCGRSTDKPNRVQFQSMLVQNYYGNGFLQAIRTDITGTNQIQNLYIQGADKTQNANLKKCNTAYTNLYDSFSVTKVKFIEIQEVADSFDKDNNRYNQYSARANSQLQSSSNVAKCTGLDVSSLIISNDNPYNFLSNSVNAANKILTSQIDFNDIKGYLKNFGIDENSLKASKIILSNRQAQMIFDKYTEDLKTQTNTCYPNIQKAAQNFQSVIVDFFLSNGRQCNLKNEISAAIDSNDISTLITIIQGNSWCSAQQARCQKSIQILKGCL